MKSRLAPKMSSIKPVIHGFLANVPGSLVISGAQTAESLAFLVISGHKWQIARCTDCKISGFRTTLLVSAQTANP